MILLTRSKSTSVKFIVLRFTLMDFEKNYQVKILSNRIIQHKEFSSAVNNTDKPRLFAESQAIDP